MENEWRQRWHGSAKHCIGRKNGGRKNGGIGMLEKTDRMCQVLKTKH